MSLVFESGRGTITIPESALEQVAVHAAETISGVQVRRRRAVDVDAKLVRLGISVRDAEPLVTVGESVQRAVVGAFTTMCGLAVKVDVAIEELG